MGWGLALVVMMPPPSRPGRIAAEKISETEHLGLCLSTFTPTQGLSLPCMSSCGPVGPLHTCVETVGSRPWPWQWLCGNAYVRIPSIDLLSPPPPGSQNQTHRAIRSPRRSTIARLLGWAAATAARATTAAAFLPAFNSNRIAGPTAFASSVSSPPPSTMEYAQLMASTLEQHKLPLRNDKDLDPILEAIGTCARAKSVGQGQGIIFLSSQPLPALLQATAASSS